MCFPLKDIKTLLHETTFHKVLVPSSRDLFSLSLKSIIHFTPSLHSGMWGFSTKTQWYLSALSSTRGDNKGQALDYSFEANESISIKMAAIKNGGCSVVAAQQEDRRRRTGESIEVIEVSLIFCCRDNSKPELCQNRQQLIIFLFCFEGVFFAQVCRTKKPLNSIYINV